MQDPNAKFDDFDMFISPEELQDDNPIDEDFEPDFDYRMEYDDDEVYHENGENDPLDMDF